MRRRTTRDNRSGKLIEDLRIDGNTSERMLRRALRKSTNVDVVIEVKPDVVEWESAEMSAGDATRYRAATARLIFLAQDRADIQFASKECSRNIARPCN